jgi:glycosyltransferase involved in cell wall biosynthesis
MTIDSVELSLIVPVFNEEEVVTLFITTVEKVLSQRQISYELLFINDGSKDNTHEVLVELSKNNNRIKIINLSRNFGKEQALSAGLDFASGRAAIPIDCDLQDPPEVIIEMYDKWQEGFDVILAKRIDRSSDGFIKRKTSAIFYDLINAVSDIDIPKNVGDFRLIDRKVIDVLKTYSEKTRFMKGIFASVGFKQATVEYTRPERAAGTTSWNYLGLYKLAIEGIVSFTSVPLKIWSYVGAIVSIMSFIYGMFLFARTLIWGVDLPGYTSLMVVLLVMSGLILLSLGVIGEYISRIFIELKGRPIYIVMDKTGFED